MAPAGTSSYIFGLFSFTCFCVLRNYQFYHEKKALSKVDFDKIPAKRKSSKYKATICVTGGLGFVGSEIVTMLLEKKGKLTWYELFGIDADKLLSGWGR